VNCDEWFERLYQILDRDVDEKVWAEVEAHMKRCRRCWDRYEFEIRIKTQLKKSCAQEPCSDSLRTRIQALLKKY
jgi:mycothiol system anti-sigma-R factor